MTIGWKGWGALMFGGLLTWAALSGAPEESHRQVVVEWQEENLLLVGDTRNGDVRVFRVDPQPTPIFVLRAPGRDAVLDIRVDNVNGGVWVVGRNGEWLHALGGGRVLARMDRPAHSHHSRNVPHSAVRSYAYRGDT